MRRPSTCAIAVALIVAMVGCSTAPTQYNLTISSTEGGSVTDPGEGTFPYPAGAVVSLLAEPGESYKFVNWTGDVGGIADVHAAATTVTMMDGYSVTANFLQVEAELSFYEAFSYIEDTTNAHPGDLPSFLRINETVRIKYTNAHTLLATAVRELDQPSSQRQEIYDFYKGLINTYPQYFRKSVVYDTATESAMAWIRERAHRTIIDALPLSDARRSEISATIGLHNRYLDIWNDFTVLLLDNTSSSEEQKDFIYAYLNSLPNGIHNLRSISVVEFLGQALPEVPLWGLEGCVNIFGVDIGGHSGNTFPEDVSPGIVDTFCIVVAHEINHVVDAFYIENNDVLKARKDELIADAGYEHLNYLRSMFEDGFFQQAPQEFFASMSHQWFTDSRKTIELGLVRFDDGHRDPINQALFFADAYSLGENFTYFYAIDTQGYITRQTIPLSRDANRRIRSLTINGTVYTFALDGNGDVTAYSVTH